MFIKLFNKDVLMFNKIFIIFSDIDDIYLVSASTVNPAGLTSNIWR